MNLKPYFYFPLFARPPSIRPQNCNRNSFAMHGVCCCFGGCQKVGKIFFFCVQLNPVDLIHMCINLKVCLPKRCCTKITVFCWELAQRTILSQINLFKFLFHHEMVGVTNFGLLPGICIVKEMVFINKLFVNSFVISICDFLNIPILIVLTFKI